MLLDANWASYLQARRNALQDCLATDAAPSSIGRASERLRAYLRLTPEEALHQARRSFLHVGDAAFHDELLAAGGIDLMRALIEATETAGDPLPRGRGLLAVGLHYGPATSVLPLWLAAASREGVIGRFAAIQNSRRNPSVMLSPARLEELRDGGFPITDLDIARLGELGALRRALAILNDGGVVLIFADGQLPPQGTKRAIRCRLGHGALALAQGPEWLARSADVALLPLLIRPSADGHRVMVLPTAEPEQTTDAIQALLDAAMRPDPAPWARWCAHAAHF